MNKTAIKVLQEMIRKNNFSALSLSHKLNKAKTTIYDCFRNLRKAQILDKNNLLQENELTIAYKKLLLIQPYDFSFLTKNNLKILSLLTEPISFKEIIKQSQLSRYTVNQLLKQLKNRGFINKDNQLSYPKELLELMGVINRFKISLPPDAVVIYQDSEHEIILAETRLPLEPTAFSAFNIKIISPHYYYTTKTKITPQEIFDDAKTISTSKREELITALFYQKNQKKLKVDPIYKKIIQSEDFMEFEKNA